MDVEFEEERADGTRRARIGGEGEQDISASVREIKEDFGRQ